MTAEAQLLRALPLDASNTEIARPAWLQSHAQAWSDAQLASAVAAAIAAPKTANSSSFVLHAPLELAARFLLLQQVSEAARDDARRRIASIAPRYAAMGEEAPAPGQRYANTDIAQQIFIESVDSGNVEKADAAIAFLQSQLTISQLRAMLVDAIAPICGSARTAPHNYVFVDSAVNALKLDPAFNDGWYETQPLRGVLAFGHVYSAWLFSQDFFREKLYEKLGLASREDVVKFTQRYFLANDANDLIAMARTWMAGDISANPRFNGDFDAALTAITCRAIVMPGDTDLYFRVPDNEYEVARMSNAELRPIPSKWGHGAGFGIDPADNAFIDKALAELLS